MGEKEESEKGMAKHALAVRAEFCGAGDGFRMIPTLFTVVNKHPGSGFAFSLFSSIPLSGC